MVKSGLGRGLSALIPNVSEDVFRDKTAQILEMDIKRVYPNKDQPRKYFNDEKIESLSDSIKIHGVVQPIIVKKEDDNYMIIAGERRWRAAKKAGLGEIPIIIKDYDEVSLAQISLIENIQREDLNDIEEAVAYKSLIDDFGLTQESLAESVGKSRTHITNTMRLLKLSDNVQELIARREISGGHGRTLLRIDNKEIQFKVAQEIISKGLSVRHVEDMIGTKKKKKKKIVIRQPEIVEIENNLQSSLGTKVMISTGKKTGKIEIEFYGEEDLERILHLLSN